MDLVPRDIQSVQKASPGRAQGRPDPSWRSGVWLAFEVSVCIVTIF